MLHESCMSDQQPNRNKAESRIYKCHWRNGARASLTTQQQTFITKILNVRFLKFTLVTLSINPESSTSPKMPKSKGHRLEKALVVRIFFNCPKSLFRTKRKWSRSPSRYIPRLKVYSLREKYTSGGWDSSSRMMVSFLIVHIKTS